MNSIRKDPASFRDSDGFIFEYEGSVYRAVNETYLGSYSKFISSGLYNKLIDEGLLVAHEEERNIPFSIPQHPLILKPFQIKHLTYPYEWSFEQYKDAALCTLRIQELALSHGFSLKDASPFNIQFVDGRPKFIDTLSFFTGEKKLWSAYRQFCESFLAPLALMAYLDHDFVRMGRIYQDGIPLQLASSLLPFRSWLKMSLFIHLHLNARAQRSRQKNAELKSSFTSRMNQKNLVTGLQQAIQSLPKSKSFLDWKKYYSDDCIDPLYLKNKVDIIDKSLKEIKPRLVVDIGSNIGIFSEIASAHSEMVIAVDHDPSSIEELYRSIKKKGIKNIIPVVMNVLNPSPSLGWLSNERKSFWDRVDPDVIMLLGTSHHLIGQGNITFSMLADLCLKTNKYVFFEFVPDTDPNYKQLFRSRINEFKWYNQEELLKAFDKHFSVKKTWKLEPTDRIIYLFEKKDVR